MVALPDRITVAVLQWDIQTDQVEANLTAAAALMQQAIAAKADLVLLPEMWTRSFCNTALTIEAGFYQDRLEFCRDQARKGRFWLGAGTLPEPADGNPATPASDKVYNTFHVFDPAGDLVLKYRKMHLFPNTGEPDYFLAGTEIPRPVTTGNWTIGAGICYDLRFPELFRAQMARGANLFLVPAQFPRPREDHFTLLARARAMENLSFLLAANRCGMASPLVFPGNSLVLDFWGNPLGEMQGQTGFFSTQIDVRALSRTRQDFPFLHDTPLLHRPLADPS